MIRLIQTNESEDELEILTKTATQLVRVLLVLVPLILSLKNLISFDTLFVRNG